MPRFPSPAQIGPHLLTALVATIGGAVFWWLHIPLPWMLGALAATGALAWNGHAAVAWPIRPLALILLGLGLGQTFTPSVMAAVGFALPWLVVAAVLSILAGAMVARLFARLAGTDAQTGYYASVPGGVIVMAILAQRAGIPATPVILAQTIRVILVVAIVPAAVTLLVGRGEGGAFLTDRPEVHLAGLAALALGGLGTAFVGHKLGLANPWMLGPCALVIALAAFGALPSGVPMWMLDAAQVGLGMALGLRLNRERLMSARRLVIAAAGTTLLLGVVMAALAVGLAWAAGLPVGATVLGMAPGGMPEMAITAKTLEVGVPLVLGFHLIRTLLANLFVSSIWRAAVRLGLVR